MRNRGLSIALAVLLAIVGTAGILVYVSHANSRAVAGQRAVTVLVAQKLIPAGTSAGQAQQQGLLGTETLPAASVPANAVTALTPDLKALVTSADVPSGQLLLRPMLVTASQATSGLAIPPGMVAVSATFCLAEAVAGNVHPGSDVAVFQTVISGGSGTMTAQTACNGSHQWTAGANFSTRLVLPKVEVLSVQTGLGLPGSGSGNGSGSTQGGSSGSGQVVVQLLTLAVSQADAQQLILMTEDSLPYLALVTDQSGLNVGTAPATISGH
jgi:pilus assembly protein CpaB